jgi:hypothetical protein
MNLKQRATIVLTIALLGAQAAAFAQSGQTQMAALDARFAGISVDPSAGPQAPGGDAQTQPAAPQNQIPPAQTTDSNAATPAPAQPNAPAPTQQQVSPQESAPQNATPQMTPANSDQPSPNTTPATPTATQQSGAALPDSPAPQQAAPAQTTPAQQTTQAQPAGTAAAERARTRGGVASRPAGVAIAPAKQHQVRSILIKTGAILAGAAALGTVYALHNATPSNPPGAANGIRR